MKPISSRAFLATFLIPVSLLLGAETPKFDQAKLAAVPAAMKGFVEKTEIAGAVTAVSTRDGIVQIDAVGKADIDKGTAIAKDSLFWIASMTKPITGTAVLMMKDEGKLSIDDPISKYIPELKDLKTADGKPAVVTIRHILTHTSGMGEASSEDAKKAKTLADLIPVYAKKPLAFEPGSQWRYCQSGINTAARIVEIVSGESYPEFLEKRLFGPLGMKDTTFYPSAEQVARLAKSYKRLPDGKLEEAKVFILEGRDPSARDRYPAANGGLFSTASDYSTFLRMILNNGTLDGKKYLSPESVKLMTTVQSGEVKTGFTPGNGWGLGWCVVREPQGVSGALSAGSHGHGGAYGTQAWIDPVKGVAYVLMVQRANFPNSDASDVRKAFQDAAAEAITK